MIDHQLYPLLEKFLEEVEQEMEKLEDPDMRLCPICLIAGPRTSYTAHLEKAHGYETLDISPESVISADEYMKERGEGG